jgi:hypothetical protein
MKTVEQSIEINAPAEVVFDQISNFGLFPQWLHGIGRVRLISPTRAHWATETLAGESVEWETETGVFAPDRHIAWHSMGGDLLAEGEAVLEATGEQTTLLRFSLSYGETPSSPAGVADYLLGDDPEQQLHDSLVRLQQLAERAAEYGPAGQFPQTVPPPTFLSSLPKPLNRARPLDVPAAGEAYERSFAETEAEGAPEAAAAVPPAALPTAVELPHAAPLPPARPIPTAANLSPPRTPQTRRAALPPTSRQPDRRSPQNEQRRLRARRSPRRAPTLTSAARQSPATPSSRCSACWPSV